jgi:L-lactate dehydrogenase complex protein LldG
MTTSRDKILSKLRAAKQPFPDAPPRPQAYRPVTNLDDTSPDALVERFVSEMTLLKGEAFVVEGDNAACEKVRELLISHQTTRLLAWDFRHIPINNLENPIRDLGIEIIHPDIHDEFRYETLVTLETAQVGLTGVDFAIAATGTLVVSTGEGKPRIPTVLPPVHIAVVTLNQIIPRLENWIAYQRANGLPTIHNSANVCFISGPSRTGDIEKQLVLGMHGPGQVQVVIKK